MTRGDAGCALRELWASQGTGAVVTDSTRATERSPSTLWEREGKGRGVWAGSLDELPGDVFSREELGKGVPAVQVDTRSWRELPG